MTFAVKGKRTIAKGLSLEKAAEVAIDHGGHLAIIDEATGAVAIADTDGDYMTIGATEKLLVEYEKNPSSRTLPATPSLSVQKRIAVQSGGHPKDVYRPSTPEPDPETVRPRFMAAPKRRRS